MGLREKFYFGDSVSVRKLKNLDLYREEGLPNMWVESVSSKEEGKSKSSLARFKLILDVFLMGEGLTILDWKVRLSDCERLTLRGTDSMIERTKVFFKVRV